MSGMKYASSASYSDDRGPLLPQVGTAGGGRSQAFEDIVQRCGFSGAVMQALQTARVERAIDPHDEPATRRPAGSTSRDAEPKTSKPGT